MRVLRPEFLIASAVVVVLAAAMACTPSKPAEVPEVVIAPRAALPSEPTDVAWVTAPVHVARLILQDMVEPRLLEASTSEVRVQAVTDGTRVAFRLEWRDDAGDDRPGPARFSDACAIQIPSKVSPDVPAPQMGETGRPVEITFWRAAWQAVVDGRGDTVKDLYPNATTDHYPFQAASLKAGSEDQRAMEQRYSPARAMGNHMAGPRQSPTEDLTAEGPGTLSPRAGGGSSGKGVRTPQGWAVVIARPLPAGLGPAGRSQVAFAVWQGSHQEAGSRKMRTGWVPLSVEAAS